MKHSIKRTFALLLGVVMLLGVFAAGSTNVQAAETPTESGICKDSGTGAHPVEEKSTPVSSKAPDRLDAIHLQYEDDNYVSYSFENFEDLKELCAGTYDKNTEFSFWSQNGDGVLTISENITLPENVHLYVWGKVVIPEGVTVTIPEKANGFYVRELEVNGVVECYAYSTIAESLTVNGKIYLDDCTFCLQNAATLSGLENIELSGWAQVIYDHYARSLDEVYMAIELSYADPNGLQHNIYCQPKTEEITFSSITIPENCRLCLRNGWNAENDVTVSYTIPAGVTITNNGELDIYSWNENNPSLNVKGKLVNNGSIDISFDAYSTPLLTFSSSKNYSGKGILYVYCYYGDNFDWTEVVSGLDTANLEVNDYGYEIQIRDASDLTKLSAPTDLAWHRGLNFVEDNSDRGYHYEVVTRMGDISFRSGEITDDSNDFQFYFVQLYKDGEPYYWWRWGFTDYYAENNLPCVVEASTSMNQEGYEWESGTYYFTVQAIPNPQSNTPSEYRSSDIVTSKKWTYTKPSKSLATPGSLSFDWPTMSWSKSSGTYYYDIGIFFTPSADEEPRQIYSYGDYGTSVTLDEYDLEFLMEQYGSGFYSFRVRAMSGDITTAYHSEWSKLSEPVFVGNEKLELASVNVASSGKIKLTWNELPNAEKYQVYVATSKNGTYKLLKTTTNTTLTHTGAEAGKAYYYKVRAVYPGGGKSAYSNIEGRYCDLPPPTLTTENVASTGKIKLSWNAVEGATKYEVYRSTDGKNWTKLVTTTKTSVTHTGAVAGQAYYYKVRALHSVTSSNSAYSTVKSRYCDLARPTLTLTNVASTGKIKLSWKAITGADRYEVYRSTDGKTWTKMITTTKTSVTHTGAAAGNLYYYKLRAICDDASGANSAYSTAKSRRCDLARPTLTVTLNSKGKPVLSWKAISGATKYEVYRSTDGETWTRLITTTKTSVTHTGAAAGTTYYYKVRAVHTYSSANSAYSTVKSIAVE